MNVLVTGGAGYVGSKLLERLVMNQNKKWVVNRERMHAKRRVSVK